MINDCFFNDNYISYSEIDNSEDFVNQIHSLKNEKDNEKTFNNNNDFFLNQIKLNLTNNFDKTKINHNSEYQNNDIINISKKNEKNKDKEKKEIIDIDKIKETNKTQLNGSNAINESYTNKSLKFIYLDNDDNFAYNSFLSSVNTKNEEKNYSSYLDFNNSLTPIISRDSQRKNIYFNIYENNPIDLISKIEIKGQKKEKEIKQKIFSKSNIFKVKNCLEEEEDIENKCFPFKLGRGIINFEESKISNSNSKENIAEKKQNDYYLIKFNIKKYYINEFGKKRKIMVNRKNNKDLIRKKIKSRFHRLLKNIINAKLKNVGSKKLFDFLPQCFLINLQKKINSKYLELTYKELLTTDFTLELNKTNDYKNKDIDKKKCWKNKNVLEYLKQNPDIAKKSGFDKIQNMKYKDLMKAYFISKEFEDSIIQLKKEKETHDYIQTYIYYAKTYIKFFSNNSNEDDNNNEKSENEEEDEHENEEKYYDDFKTFSL